MRKDKSQPVKNKGPDRDVATRAWVEKRELFPVHFHAGRVRDVPMRRHNGAASDVWPVGTRRPMIDQPAKRHQDNADRNRTEHHGDGVRLLVRTGRHDARHNPDDAWCVPPLTPCPAIHPPVKRAAAGLRAGQFCHRRWRSAITHPARVNARY